MPTMPEESPAGFGETSFFGGASSSFSASGTGAASPVAGNGGDSMGGGGLTPVARQDSFTATTGRTGVRARGCGRLLARCCAGLLPRLARSPHPLACCPPASTGVCVCRFNVGLASAAPG